MDVQPAPLDDNALAALIAALASPDWITRNEAMDTLLSLGVQAHDALQKTITAGTMPYAVHAARILYQQRTPQIFELMQQLVVSRNPLLGQIATNYVALYGRHDTLEILLRSLPNSTYLVKLTIVEIFGLLRAMTTIEPLLALLKETSGSTLRMTIVTALGRIGDRRTLPVIRGLIEDNDPHVSRMARHAAAQLDGEHVIDCTCVHHAYFRDCAQCQSDVRTL